MLFLHAHFSVKLLFNIKTKHITEADTQSEIRSFLDRSAERCTEQHLFVAYRSPFFILWLSFLMLSFYCACKSTLKLHRGKQP